MKAEAVLEKKVVYFPILVQVRQLKTKKTGICESMLCGTQCVQCDMLAVFGIWIDSIYYVVWSIRYLDHVGIQNHDNNLLRERI